MLAMALDRRFRPVPRTQRSAVSAFTRVFDALWWCAAEPGPSNLVWVLALRSSVKDAAPGPGHEDIQTLRARPTGARREGVAITTMHSPSIASPRNSNTNASNTIIPPANH
jgi:hypothetical protein